MILKCFVHARCLELNTCPIVVPRQLPTTFFIPEHPTSPPSIRSSQTQSSSPFSRPAGPIAPRSHTTTYFHPKSQVVTSVTTYSTLSRALLAELAIEPHQTNLNNSNHVPSHHSSSPSVELPPPPPHSVLAVVKHPLRLKQFLNLNNLTTFSPRIRRVLTWLLLLLMLSR